ncbi:MAG: hypothetical protein H6Q72_1495 [Firmicutes bacterium]|nr:hypothetical protein [Bacillota bacterium]
MVDEIYSLRNQMVYLGYATREIDAWISHVIGDIPFEQLNDEDCIELINSLKDYVSYATRKAATAV